MNVSIPQHDQDPNSRQAALERDRSYYEYDYTYYNLGFANPKWLEREGEIIREHAVECATASKKPRRGLWGKLEGLGEHLVGEVRGAIEEFGAEHGMEGYRPELSHEFVHAQLRWLMNRAAATAKTKGEDTERAAKAALADGRALVEKLLKTNKGRHEILDQIAALGHEHGSANEAPQSMQAYIDMFQLIPMPEFAKLWDEDWAFAYQTVAGCLPIHIERIDTLPENFAVTEAIYAKVMGLGSSLAADLEAKKVFLLDFSVFEGYSGGRAYGRQKYMYAPLALFTWRKTDEHGGFGLTPVAIQCGQTPGDACPVFTPLDGWRWKMARFCVQVATAMYRGANLHFGGLHIVMERICISIKRTLAPNHPLRLLLERSFESTLATNATTRTFTFPDGYSSKLLAPTMPASIQLILDGVDKFNFAGYCPPRLFKDRGVDDPDILPVYPFREDTTKLWAAVQDFCRSYIGLYYGCDGEVRGDTEVQAWVRLLQAPEGGRFKHVGRDGVVETVEDLVQIVAQIVYHGSAFHSAINYSGFDVTSFPPSMCYAGFAAPPTWDTPDTQEAFMAMLPPMEYAWIQFLLDLDQITIWENQLGHFPDGYFEDARVAPLVERLQKQLGRIEQEIHVANTQRPLPYKHQCPPWVTASIES